MTSTPRIARHQPSPATRVPGSAAQTARTLRIRRLACTTGGGAGGLALALALGRLAVAPTEGALQIAGLTRTSVGGAARSEPSVAPLIVPASNAVRLPVRERDAEAP